MFRTSALLCLLGIAYVAKSQTVIISQYIETSSGTTPKVIELWNPSGVDIDMSSTNIVVEKGVNGGTPSADITISSGTLKAGEVLVVGTTNTSETSDCDTYISESFTFNGDDALVVKLNGTITDMFGTAGSDPGSSWSGSGVSTANQNIQLKSGITTGDVDGWTDPSTRFETVNTTNVMTGFGIPPGGCPGPTSNPALTATPGHAYLAYLASSGGPSLAKEITLSGEDLGSNNATATASTDYEIATTSGGSYSSSLNFSPSSGSISTSFFVRLKSGKTAGQYNGTVTISHDSITNFDVNLTGAATSGNDTIKVVSYNLLAYGGANTQERNVDYRTLMTELNTDIITVCELNTGSTGFELFRDSVLAISSPHFKAGDFIVSNNLSNGAYYDSSKFTFISNVAINTALRDISEFTFIHNYSLDTFRVYAVHLKASSGSANEILRAAEVHELRKVTDALPSGSNFIVQGDFNMYDNDEPGYDSLTVIKSGVEGQFYDPVTMPVSSPWNHSSNAAYLTQSTRTRSFNGGATSGLDDRFDMMLYSNALGTSSDVYYLSNSFTAYGNDGAHFDDSINAGTNSAVSAAIADALHFCSDHLPVVSQFVFEDGGFPLPVSMVWFKGKVNEAGGTDLVWQTASEFNNKGFEVQRFDEEKGVWTALDFVDGQGTTDIITDYNYVDNEVLSNVVRYYRLKQIDHNGAYEFSDVIVIDKRVQFADFTVAPNPFNDHINVFFADNKKRNVELALLDLSGRTLQTSNFTGISSNHSLQTNEIPAGIYLLQVTAGSYTQVVRILKR